MVWLEDINRSIGLLPQIILYGNINDMYLEREENSANYKTLRRLLQSLFTNKGYKLVGFYDIVDGLRFASGEMRQSYDQIMAGNNVKQANYQGGFGKVQQEDADSQIQQGGTIQFPSPIDALSAIRRIMANRIIPSIVIVNYSEKLVSGVQQDSEEEKRLHILMHKISQEAQNVKVDNNRILKNTSVLVADELGSLPTNLYINNPYTKQIHIGRPLKHDREKFVKFYGDYFFSEDGSISNDEFKRFVDLTDGMTIVDLVNLAAFSNEEQIPFERAKELVTIYKFGKKHDYWAELDIDKIMKAESIIGRRVIGQDEALKAVVDMIIRAKMGMAGIQHSSSSAKPKGTLLFVGPTGVGKTELAKATAEFLFGDENACIRFDMSEYNHEHADQRLVGAPPGYVGFEEGGQLTNKVKEKPFAILLFDEIEKAHPRIFDKFLQVLEDGRLTDGKGETVYFSETVIIFTSNIGSAQPIPEGATKQEIQDIFVQAVNQRFRVDWGRPELLNRIGENIIVFQPIISYEFKKNIIKKMLDQVASKILNQFNVKISWDESIYDLIVNHPAGFGKNGARGAGNLVEKLIINNLSRSLFFNKICKGEEIVLSWDNDIEEILIKRKPTDVA